MMPSFTMRVEGTSIDTAEVRKALSILIEPNTWHELRGIDPFGGRPPRSRLINGSNLDDAVESAKALSDTHVYWSLNPVTPGARTANKKTVTKRRWLLIDVDTVRIKEVSASDEEKEKSYTVAERVHQHLFFIGWPQPLMIDSGNGWHLLYRIDLPNDPLSHQIIRGVTEALGEKFDNQYAIIDRVVHDSARISKLPGTMARKGIANVERPHRMARIIYQPEELKVVTFEQLRVIGGASGGKRNRQGQAQQLYDESTNPRPPGSTIHVGSGLESYVQKAIEDECFAVANSQNNSLGRNNTLNRSAFCLGTLSQWPEAPTYKEVHDRLYRAAVQAGLDIDPNCGPHGITRSIESGWTSGIESPRPRPDTSKYRVNGQPRANDTESAQLLQKIPEKLTQGLDEIEVKTVEWLWQDRIARNFVSVFAGRTGMGKSFVTCDFIARLSRGDTAPFSDQKLTPGRTLVISEDPPEYMLGPRLLELKTDPSMVRFMTYKAMAQFRLDRIDMLEAAYHECGEPVLVVIDPPSNFCGRIDTHKDSELRGILMLIVEWINRHNCAMVFIMHLNKAVGKGIDAITRLMGSAAWGTTARVVNIFEQDPDEPTQYLMAGGKSNIGIKAGTLAYKIEKTETLATINWVGPVETSADDAVNRVQKKPRVEKANDWIMDRFREQPSWPSEDLYAEAKACGISRSAIWEAQKDMPLERKKVTNDGKSSWCWSAPYGWPPSPDDDVYPSQIESEGIETLHPQKYIENRETLETLETLDTKSSHGKDLGSVSKNSSRETLETVETLEKQKWEAKLPSVSSVSRISVVEDDRESLKELRDNVTPCGIKDISVDERNLIKNGQQINLNSLVVDKASDGKDLDETKELVLKNRDIENPVKRLTKNGETLETLDQKPSQSLKELGDKEAQTREGLSLKELGDRDVQNKPKTNPPIQRPDGWVGAWDWFDGKGKQVENADNQNVKPELMAAIRLVTRMLRGAPVSKSQIIDVGNRNLLDSQDINKAAELLKVKRSMAGGVELWSKPE